MDYREQPAAPGFEPWLECVWQQAAGADAVRVIPDGCIDLVWLEGRGALIAGPNTTAYLVRGEPGQRSAGVRLHPGAAAEVLGIAPEGLCDARVGVVEAWGDAGRALEEALARAAAGPAAVLAAVVERRAAMATRPDPAVRAAVTRLAAPGARVAGVAAEVGFSERQLRRRVTAAVGYGPKQLVRVLRLRRALAAVDAGAELASAALAAGYVDQAHFTGDCRELAGVPPGALRSA